jgi:hypothetical protein
MYVTLVGNVSFIVFMKFFIFKISKNQHFTVNNSGESKMGP